MPRNPERELTKEEESLLANFLERTKPGGRQESISQTTLQSLMENLFLEARRGASVIGAKNWLEDRVFIIGMCPNLLSGIIQAGYGIETCAPHVVSHYFSATSSRMFLLSYNPFLPS